MKIMFIVVLVVSLLCGNCPIIAMGQSLQARPKDSPAPAGSRVLNIKPRKLPPLLPLVSSSAGSLASQDHLSNDLNTTNPSTILGFLQETNKQASEAQCKIVVGTPQMPPLAFVSVQPPVNQSPSSVSLHAPSTQILIQPLPSPSASRTARVSPEGIREHRVASQDARSCRCCECWRICSALVCLIMSEDS